jgi:hypothetical protein
MENTKEILVAWDDQPENEMIVTVAIGLDVIDDENDENIFWYFADEKELTDAKNGVTPGGFRVVHI